MCEFEFLGIVKDQNTRRRITRKTFNACQVSTYRTRYREELENSFTHSYSRHIPNHISLTNFLSTLSDQKFRKCEVSISTSMKMLTSQNSIKVAVIGAKSVGKSALVVRFLTKRYIGEYNSAGDHVYKNPIKSFLMKKSIKLLDTSGCFKDKNEMQCNDILDWANGLVIVYDISDRNSFNIACNIVRQVRNSKHPKEASIPITIIGNKQDLENGRQISFHEGHQLALNNSAKFFEISTAESYDSVKMVFELTIEDSNKSIVSNKQFQEVAKMSQLLVTSPLHLLDSVIYSRKHSFSGYDLGKCEQMGPKTSDSILNLKSVAKRRQKNQQQYLTIPQSSKKILMKFRSI